MQYQKLAEVYEKASSTTKRLEKTDILSEFLKELKKDESEVLYLLLGDVYASYDERKLGMSNQLVIKALTKATGISKDKIISEWKDIGDIGLVAEKVIKKKQQATLGHKSLTIKKVIENLRKLPELEGKGTVDKKVSLITELLISASPLEAKYLVRAIIGDLRIGVQESTIRDAIAKAYFPNNQKEAGEKIQRAVDNSNDIAKVFEIAVKKKFSGIEKIDIEVGKPVKVMLAQKAESIKDGFKQAGKPAVVEFKYDGFRMIIHKKDKEVKLFTRNLENVTKQFPEVIDYIKKYVKGKSFIIDSEAVGYDKKTKKYTPFQNISQRIKRKHKIAELQEKLPVEINVFDVLYYNGKSLVDKPLKERRKLLEKIIEPQRFKIVKSKEILTDDEKKAAEFYKKALEMNQEGIMFKNPDAEYKPGRKVGHMLKLKPEENDLDLVITGAEYGTGKRSGWLSSFIISCKNKEEFLEVGKVSTGFKEKETQSSKVGEDGGVSFEELTNMLQPYILKEKGKKVEIKPKIIVSVSYQEVQQSPNYNSGIALRFPRFVKLRPDKHLSEVDTLDEIKAELEKQKKKNYQYG